MRTPTKGITTRPVVKRHFEFSRHQRMNLAVAFEHVLPVIVVRRPAPQAASRRHPMDPCRPRRAVS